ncbi:MAG: 23S rRNA (adenine(2030)-N(6))-methyltransferase RlmJ [Magnetococcus sp. WYHC-3]
MLSYQHAFHAGNAADVHKHATLAVLLAHLVRKDKPLSYLETHAGDGLYDLESPEARKTGESDGGIGVLLASALMPLDHPYRRALESVASIPDMVRPYPGSPAIARALLRPGDTMHLMERHPAAYAALRRRLRSAAVHIHLRDGYEGVLALVPPTPRRGLVLVDPSYEVKSEFVQVGQFIPALHRKWPQAVIMVWYPLLEEPWHEPMCRELEPRGLPGMQRVEVRFSAAGRGLRGSGILLVNRPFGVEAALAQAAAWVPGGVVMLGGA